GPTLRLAPRLDAATLRVVSAAGHRVAWVEARDPKPLTVVVEVARAGLRAIDSERTGAIGDGERTLFVHVDENGTFRHQETATVFRCDGEQRLFREKYDWASGRFVSVAPPVAEGEALAVRKAPLASTSRFFHWSSASSSLDAQGRADLLGAP